MKYLLSSVIVIVLMTITSYAFSQVTTQWSSAYNGTGNDTDIVTSMTVDGQGNVYVTGYSKGNLTGKDIATIKYNSSGQQIWAARYNNDFADMDDAANAITLDNSGNVYVTGYSTGLVSFKDYVTLKYDPDGVLIWSAIYNGSGSDDDVSAAIAINSFGNVYVTGYSVGSITSEDYLTIKYSSDGTELWTSVYDNPEMNDIDIANSLMLDASGNIIVSGYSIGAGSAEDFATVKYDPLGNEQWVKRFNGTGNNYDITSGIAVDPSGNIIVTGFSLGSGSSEDYVTLKYDTDGNNIWTNTYNGSSNSYDIPTSVTSDAQGNVYVTGYSYDKVTSEDYTTIKYSPAGDQEWISKYDGESSEFDIAKIIKTDNNGGIYVTGYSYDFNSLEDYTTVKYNTSGQTLWVERYNGISNGSDIASSLFTGTDGNIYLTGFSYDGPAGVDYVTIKYSQTVGIDQTATSLSESFSLKQNYPNPFNPSTVLEFEISKPGIVTLKVYDILGKEVATLANSKLNIGIYKYNFDASQLTNGIYFYTLSVNGLSETKKMLLLK